MKMKSKTGKDDKEKQESKSIKYICDTCGMVICVGVPDSNDLCDIVCCGENMKIKNS